MTFNAKNPLSWPQLGIDLTREVAQVPFKVASAVTPKPLRPLLDVPSTLADLPFRGFETARDVASNAAGDLVGRGPARLPTRADSPEFQDKRFQERGWSEMPMNATSRGRYKIRMGGEIYAETTFGIRVPAGESTDDFLAEVARQLRQPWTFYGKGSVEDWTPHADGRVTYLLKPTGFGLGVFETMGTPLRTRSGGYRIPVRLERDAHGFAYLEIERGAAPNTIEIRGRFAGVRPGGAGHLFGPAGYARNHLLAESGQASDIPLLGALLEDGGGLAGLIRREGWSACSRSVLRGSSRGTLE